MVRHNRPQLIIVTCAATKRRHVKAQHVSCRGIGALVMIEQPVNAAVCGGECSTCTVPPCSVSSPSDTGRSSGVVNEAHWGSPIQRGSVVPGRCAPIMLRTRSADHAAACRCSRPSSHVVCDAKMQDCCWQCECCSFTCGRSHGRARHRGWQHGTWYDPQQDPRKCVCLFQRQTSSRWNVNQAHLRQADPLSPGGMAPLDLSRHATAGLVCSAAASVAAAIAAAVAAFVAVLCRVQRRQRVTDVHVLGHHVPVDACSRTTFLVWLPSA